MEQDKLNREFVRFPESYNKVRKSYGITSALLLFWGLLGLDPDSIGGNIANLKIQSPEAIPIALTLLVIYLGFRLYLEWKYYGYGEKWQFEYIHLHERSSKLPYLDYYLSHVMGVLAVLLFISQEYLDFNLIERLTIDTAPMITLFLLPFIFLIILAKSILYKSENLDKNYDPLNGFPLLFKVLMLLIFVVFIWSLFSFKILYSVTIILITILILLVVYLIYSAIQKFN